MKVEIWSDVVCPFCYIGKRKFEKALAQFEDKDQVEIVWRSFQLDPDMKPQAGQTLHQYLAQRKGVSEAEGKSMNDYMTVAAREVGLDYRLDQAVITNTLDAHRLLHFAKEYGVQSELKEKLFAAYYTQGENLGDHDTLIRIGQTAGLPADKIREMLQSDAYIREVKHDQYSAQQVGARGVPFFVFNNKYAVSGAQPVEVFTQVLDKVAEEEKPVIQNSADTGFCTPDGDCN